MRHFATEGGAGGAAQSDTDKIEQGGRKEGRKVCYAISAISADAAYCIIHLPSNALIA